ncbi:hypothetical protein [Paenibacillus sp. JSM ZJ436]
MAGMGAARPQQRFASGQELHAMRYARSDPAASRCGTATAPASP